MALSVKSQLAILFDRKAKISERVNAARVLSGKDDERATEGLIDALEGTGEEIRDAAHGALLAKWHKARLYDWLAGHDIARRIKAASAFKYIGDNYAVELLAAALSSEEPRLRLQAAWALAMQQMMLPEERARAPLLEALSDREMMVRVWAARGLEKIEQKIARTADEPQLIGALADDEEDVRISVARALARIGTEKARAAIRQRIEAEPSYRVQREMQKLLEKE